jgi:hypothetical protein
LLIRYARAGDFGTIADAMQLKKVCESCSADLDLDILDPDAPDPEKPAPVVSVMLCFHSLGRRPQIAQYSGAISICGNCLEALVKGTIPKQLGELAGLAIDELNRKIRN